MKFAKKVMAHKTGIVNFVKTKITNDIVEEINSKIQLAKR
jgi:transposase